jgi:SAM-dependent methyltransferase
MIEHAKELTECLCCASKNLTMTLDLGVQPMANSFIETDDEAELTFPLILNRCTECSHLQLSHAVDPDLLFRNYLYVSGTSKTLLEYFKWFAEYNILEFELRNGRKPDSVLEIACNDGTQLNVYKDMGLVTYGVDPATNLHVLSSKEHEVVCDYFKQEHVALFKDKVDIISAQNVLAHNSYPLEFLEQCRDIMRDDTVLFIQTSQADMVKENQFDTVYHEHISFFNVNSMNELAGRAGLHLLDVRKTPIHGNSYVFMFSKVPGDNSTVQQILAEERAYGLQNTATYEEYTRRCLQVVIDLKSTIGAYRAAGFVIAGYGAAAKGMTLLNFGGIHLDFIIDDNPLKQGRFTPGTHDPVVGIEMLDECKDLNIAFVPLAWNFFDEIKTKIKTKRDRKEDAFIRYFPTISIE